MPEQNIESKSTIRKLTLDELPAVSGGDGPVMSPQPPLIDTRPSPDIGNPLGS